MSYDYELPKRPIIRLVQEGNEFPVCSKCCSSMKKRFYFFGKILGCINQYCSSYYLKNQKQIINENEEDMPYDYEKEKQNIDNVMLASITATAQTLLDTAGSFTFPYVTREIHGKLWSMIACVDYLVEIGFIREITNKDILAERVFVKGVKR